MGENQAEKVLLLLWSIAMPFHKQMKDKPSGSMFQNRRKWWWEGPPAHQYRPLASAPLLTGLETHNLYVPFT